MYGKNALLSLVLTLILLSGVGTAMAIEELDVVVMDGTAIPFAKEDHLAYGIVKVWNKADAPVVTTLSITPNRDHRLDDNRYWGNYREVEDIKIGANELHIQVFCFNIPANSNVGKQAWTLNISAGEETITKKVEINLPITKNVEIVAPLWQPDILKISFPTGKPDTLTAEASEPKMALLMLKMAGELSAAKIYNVQLDTTLPDIFFSYPEEITVAMSEPNGWDFDNQTFLPFTVIPIPLLTVNVPYSTNGNMYELELQLEEERTGLKTGLPFQLVITMPSPTEKTVEAEVVENTTTVNETVSSSENTTVTEMASAVNSSEVVAPINTSTEEVTAEAIEEKSKESNETKNNNWNLDKIWNIIVGGAFLLLVLFALTKMKVE